MGFDPVSDRRNFVRAKDPSYFKQQQEELFASEQGGFAPDVLAEIEKLERAELLLIHFPLWWFGVPAILKGWFDRVLVMGRIYGGGRWYDQGTQAGKRAMLVLTTGGPEAIYLPDGINGSMRTLLEPIHHGVLAFLGFEVLEPRVVYAPVRLTDEQRAQALADHAARLSQLDAIPRLDYAPLSAFGADMRLRPDSDRKQTLS
ncbi:MAG TPA: NAD(P)H-dependent oxidoreductase [Planctomycetota bacterium]|nr:NAD(P)H-dependent oxidoreductase [Planctomycetota bacterium]HRV80193.1 NAD(P)H-dependent oxidoreductase [Planctomycetota bacterium]